MGVYPSLSHVSLGFVPNFKKDILVDERHRRLGLNRGSLKQDENEFQAIDRSL
jgi:hypothetical protein